jgi:hypothetical protein
MIGHFAANTPEAIAALVVAFSSGQLLARHAPRVLKAVNWVILGLLVGTFFVVLFS